MFEQTVNNNFFCFCFFFFELELKNGPGSCIYYYLSSHFMEGSFSLNVTTPPGSVTIGIVAVEIVFSIYHVASSGHVFKELCKLVGGSFS